MILRKSHRNSRDDMELIFNIPVLRKTPIPLTVSRANFQAEENGCISEVLTVKLSSLVPHFLPIQIFVETARKSEPSRDERNPSKGPTLVEPHWIEAKL